MVSRRMFAPLLVGLFATVLSACTPGGAGNTVPTPANTPTPIVKEHTPTPVREMPTATATPAPLVIPDEPVKIRCPNCNDAQISAYREIARRSYTKVADYFGAIIDGLGDLTIVIPGDRTIMTLVSSVYEPMHYPSQYVGGPDPDRDYPAYAKRRGLDHLLTHVFFKHLAPTDQIWFDEGASQTIAGSFWEEGKPREGLIAIYELLEGSRQSIYAFGREYNSPEEVWKDKSWTDAHDVGLLFNTGLYRIAEKQNKNFDDVMKATLRYLVKNDGSLNSIKKGLRLQLGPDIDTVFDILAIGIEANINYCDTYRCYSGISN